MDMVAVFPLFPSMLLECIFAVLLLQLLSHCIRYRQVENQVPYPTEEQDRQTFNFQLGRGCCRE